MVVRLKTATWIPGTDSGLGLKRFYKLMNAKYQIEDLNKLHTWSVDNSAQFWSEVWDFFEVVGDKGNRTEIPSKLPQVFYFPDAQLSVLENILSGRGTVSIVKESDIENIGEEFTHQELIQMISALANTFKEHGIVESDRLVAILPVGIEVLVTT